MCDETSGGEVVCELEKVVLKGNVVSLKKIFKSSEYASYARNTVASLVILACKHNKVKVLEFLLSGGYMTKTTAFPGNEDETHHNAFYYAIRSCNVELLDTLINKWPGNYFADHSEELDEIFSRAYAQLMLQNVPLSHEIAIFVENQLLNFRFFSDKSEQAKDVKTSLNDINDRIHLVLEKIAFLNAEYSTIQEVDERFLFIAKFITQSINILKRQLKSTYNSLPWEEIEFCLVSFICSYIKKEEINIFYQATLDKMKMLSHLNNFAQILENEQNNIKLMDISKLAELPNLNRAKVVADIINQRPQLEDLYQDYQQIRDIYSLKKINDCIQLALSVDSNEREGRIIITRVLQIIGENIKNSLESPKLSTATNEHLLLSLPNNTRKIITDLRNSFSHAYSLSKRIEIEEIKDVNFFTGIQNDVKKIGAVITDILYKSKIKVIIILLEKFLKSDNINEMNEVCSVFNNIKIDFEKEPENFRIMEQKRIEELIKGIKVFVTEPTNYEKELFSKINDIINFEKTKVADIQNNYSLGVSSLQSLHMAIRKKIHNNTTWIIKDLKSIAAITLQNLVPKMDSCSVREITELLVHIFNSFEIRTQRDNLDDLRQLLSEFYFISEFIAGDIKSIKKLREKLSEKDFSTGRRKQNATYTSTENKFNSQLPLKLSELKSILNNNHECIAHFSAYKSNKKLQAVVEMFVLDIMSILSFSKNSLADNLLFLDEKTPLLTGKCLRNHLAHENVIVNILCMSDPSISVVLNAKKFTTEDIIGNKKKIGKTPRKDVSELKNKYIRDLVMINNQKQMFIAAEEGNLEDLRSCIKRGADINGRSIHLWTALHFAAKGGNLDVVKFILAENVNADERDIRNQSPLHTAAANGRTAVVEFLIKKVGLNVDDVDYDGDTPLHVAAQSGHEDVVRILLKNKANSTKNNLQGYSVMHYAVENKHKNVVEILLDKVENIDCSYSFASYTLLHLAVEYGFLDIVNILLQRNANVNTKSPFGTTPLHSAAIKGHLEVVNVLISKGADIHARDKGGCIPLHYAVGNGHEEIADILLKHGSNINAVGSMHFQTPLHYAAEFGNKQIVMNLLKYNAKTNLATVEGMTPLHVAVKYCHLEIVSVLLKHGVNINAKDNNNSTPLHYASKAGHKDVAELLIKHKANVNTNSNCNITPLHVAASNGHECVTNLLIKYNAEVNAKDINGNTPLHAAALNGNLYVVDLLLKNKAEVNAKSYNRTTPLHMAASRGNVDAMHLLIKNQAEVNCKNDKDFTPLHATIVNGCSDCVRLLIKNGAQVNARDIQDYTPLHLAVATCHKEIMEILIAEKANVNVKTQETPLVFAVKSNNIEMVKLLIANGADVNTDSGDALNLAVIAGNKDILDILLKHNAEMNVKNTDNATLLHIAATFGHMRIVKDLIRKGVDVNAKTNNNATALYLAAERNHLEVVEVLIQNGVNINDLNDEGAPLHIAAGKGHHNVIEVLLNNGADINLKDTKNRTPAELAVAHGNLRAVKMLLQHREINVNAQGNDGWTMLHIAAQSGHFEIVSYLVDKGANINAKNHNGSQPIHIAAREGHKNVVEFFLSKGLSINAFGAAKHTLLHYTAIEGQSEIAGYLIKHGIDVNIKDANGQTPLHIAATFGCNEFIKFLLENGAIYDPADNFNTKPLDLTKNKDAMNLLESIEKLFKAVKKNKLSEVENCIKSGAITNAKNADSYTPLHFAAWKGYDGVADILLKNKADPNVVCNKGFTPLHYAAKFSHLKTVNTLLSNSAVYNAISVCGKTPSDFAVDKSIRSLFKLVSESFKDVKDGNIQVVKNLEKIKDVDRIKCIMNARNKDNQTLIVAAIHNKFPEVVKLKEILQGDVSSQLDVAYMLTGKGDYRKALSILENAYEKRKEILGLDNPGTLDVKKSIGDVLFKQGLYEEALNTLEEVLQKQTEILGLDDNNTLSTKDTIALILHTLGRNVEALNIYQDVYQKRMEILGPDHTDAIRTQFHMALVLDSLGKYDEALDINKTVFQKRKRFLGANHPLAVLAQNNIAMVMSKQNKHEESLEIYKEVYKKKKILFGIDHPDTVRTLHNIAGVLCHQDKYHEAMKTFREVLSIRKKVLGPNHPDTLTTKYNIGNLLLSKTNFIDAYQTFHECSDQMKAVYGPNHPTVLDILQKIERLKTSLKMCGINETESHCLEKTIYVAASDGDIQLVEYLLKNGADVNTKDSEGRTPLHFAVSNAQIDVMKILLKNGADVTQVTNKGNTPLHTAIAKDYRDIADILLQQVSRNKLDEIINAKTTASGTTSLHIAAKNGSSDITKLLLKWGAIYNIKNNDNKTPADLSKNQNINNLLKLIEECFVDAEEGKERNIQKLKVVKPDELLAITNARNFQRSTLLQAAIINKNRNIATQILQAINMAPKLSSNNTLESDEQLQKDI